MKNQLGLSILIAILSGICGLSNIANAQIEKTYDLSAEAKGGYIGNVEVNNEKQTMDLTYILPTTTADKTKYEIYTYDKDMNLLNTVKGEDAQKVKAAYHPLNRNTRNYKLVTTTNNLKGRLFVRKKEVTVFDNSSYYRAENLEISTYVQSAKWEDRIEVMASDGQQYFNKGGSYQIRSLNKVLVLAGKPKGEDDVYAQKNFDILSFDEQANKTVVGSLEFQYGNDPVFSAPLKDEKNISNDDFPRDWILVFAPVEKYQSGIRLKSLDAKDKDPKPTNFTYIRINPSGKVVERISFESPSSGWRITGASEIRGAVYLYGQAVTKDPAETYIDNIFPFDRLTPICSSDKIELKNGLISGSVKVQTGEIFETQGDINEKLEYATGLNYNKNYTHFQIGKISNGKLDFITATPLEDFVTKQAKSNGQKKFAVYGGEKFVVGGIYISKSGEIYVNGQNYEGGNFKSSGADADRHYKALFLFQFDAKGTLVKNYEVNINFNVAIFSSNKTFEYKNDEYYTIIPDMAICENYLSESADGKNINWIIRSAEYSFAYAGGATTYESATILTDAKKIYRTACTLTFEYGNISINTTATSMSDYTVLNSQSSSCVLLKEYTNSCLDYTGGPVIELFDPKGMEKQKNWFDRKVKPEFVLLPNSKPCTMGNAMYVFNVSANKIIVNKAELLK